MKLKSVRSLKHVSTQKKLKAHSLLASIERLELRRLYSGTWTALSNAAPGAVGTMLLLPNGTVMATTDGDGAGSDWGLLTPSATGSYVNGTWTKLANSNDTRLFDTSVVMQNGSVLVAGGEYGTGGSTGEVYNPLTNIWTRTPAQSYGGFSDSWGSLIANGNVLISPVGPTPGGYTTIYNAANNTWSQGPKLVTGNSTDEQSWVKLADGSILTAGGGQTSERYIPSSNSFVNDATVPVNLTDGLGEYGPGFLLPSGKAIFFGASGHSAIYTPSGSTAAGTWVAGPDIPSGLGEDDASGAELRDGTIIITAGPIDSYNGGTTLFQYNPVANSFSTLAGPNTYGGAPFLTRMLALPNGDVLYTENGNTLYQYDPGTTAVAAATPTISSVTPNSNGTLTLTGTNLNGINTGASYGDDAQMDSNYPVIRLTSGSNVYYASSYSWTSTGVQIGSASESVTFTLPLGIPAGTYSLVTTANGVASSPTSLTISTTANNTAPTIATAPNITPTAATGTTAALSVLGADDAGEASLVYTWTDVSAPAGASLAGFSINGTHAAKSTTAVFQQAGTYSFKVTATDAGGLSVTSGTVSVTVSQTLSSISLSPSVVNLIAGQTQQLTATGYDQFGTAMTAQPSFTWSLKSGGGSVNSGGTYTAPATGTLATVGAASGSFQATATIGVVNIPWKSTDIGNVGTAGLAYDSGLSTTLSVASDDIWNQADDFHYDYQLVSGNVTITAQLNSETSVSSYIKAGLMIRNTLDSNSAMAMVCDPSPGPLFEYRTTAGGTAAQTATSGATAPYWLQLVRNGTTFTAYASPNGTTWTQIGSQTISMNTNVYVGLAISSHDASNVATAKFSNVSVVSSQTLTSIAVISSPANLTAGQSSQLIAEAYDQNGNPMSTQPAFTWALASGGGSITAAGLYTAPAAGTLAGVTAKTGTLSATGVVDVVNSPWTSLDIGSVSTAGQAYDSGATTTLSVSSDDIWNQSDDFHFDYRTLIGNGSITAELNSQTSNSGYIKAGLMIRNSLDSNSAMAMVADPAPGPLFEWRTTTNAVAAQTATSAGNTAPYWLRLVRLGNTFTAYSSPNGTTGWTPIGSQTISMSQTVYIGLALTSHDTSNLATAVFSNVSVNQLAIATAAAASPSPVTGTTTTLSVLGSNTTNSVGEASLTYTWAATSIPTGATTPVFTINGTNAAKTTIATFSQIGAYTFTVTISDSAGDVTTSVVSVVVNQGLTSVAVTPTTASLNSNQSQQLSALGYDQFGKVLLSQPTFTWTVASGAGTVSGSGYYTAPATGTLATITATSVSIHGTATIGVVKPPWISADIGSPTLPGIAYDSTNTTTINGSGSDIYLSADQFHFDYQSITGNAGITAELTSTPVLNTDSTNSGYAKTGVMFRDSAATGASFVDLIYTNVLGIQLIYRNGTNTAAGQVGNNIAVTGAVYLKLLRSGTNFTGYYSSNGTTWNLVGSYVNAAVSGTALTGLVACSHDNTKVATVTYSNVAISQPTVVTAASATPSPVSATTAALSVLGANLPSASGEASLIYTWATTTMPGGATAPTFSASGTNAAKYSTVQFYAAGNYSFTVTIADSLGQTVTSTVSVAVNQSVASVSVSNPTVIGGGTSQASAVDQFNNAYVSAISWSVDGGGTISTTGLFTAGQTGGTFTIFATGGGTTRTTNITVSQTVFSGATGNDTYAVRLSPSNPQLEQIFVNTPETGTPTYTMTLGQISFLTFSPSGGDGSLTIDFSNGNPLPTGGISYTGGSNPTAMGNALYIIGSSAGAMGFAINAANITAAAAPSSPISYNAVQKIEFDLAGSGNSLTQSGQPSAAVNYNAGSGSNTLIVNVGTFTFSANPQSGSGDLTVNDNSNITFAAGASGSGINLRSLAGLNLGASATATLNGPASETDRMLLTVNSLALDNTAQIDLSGNDLDVKSGDLTALTNAIARAYNATGGGIWQGDGITSSLAGSNSSHLTALGILQNSDASGNAIYGTGTLLDQFDGFNPAATDVLIKYTYIGDANLDGKVDGSDYALVDNGYLNQLTGWSSGNFNYGNSVDGSDYTLIDNAFNTQGAQLTASIAAVVASKPTTSALVQSKQAKTGTKLLTLNSGLFASSSPITFANADLADQDVLHRKLKRSANSLLDNAAEG